MDRTKNFYNSNVKNTKYESIREEKVAENKRVLRSMGLDAEMYQYSMPKLVNSTRGKRTQRTEVSELLPRRSRRLHGSRGDEEYIHTKSNDAGHKSDDSHEESKVRHEDIPHDKTKLSHGENLEENLDEEEKMMELYLKLKKRFEGGTSNQPAQILHATSKVVNQFDHSNGNDVPRSIVFEKKEHLVEPDKDKSPEKHHASYRKVEREAKYRKMEGKKPFLLEVRDGIPFGNNSSRWATELGIRVRSHLDVSIPFLASQESRNINMVIQKMENTFETIGGNVSMAHYRNKMRIILNNYRYQCRKMIHKGEKRDGSLSVKQWDDLNDGIRSNEYAERSNRAKRARSFVQKTSQYGRGGVKAKEGKFEEKHKRLPTLDELDSLRKTTSEQHHTEMSTKRQSIESLSEIKQAKGKEINYKSEGKIPSNFITPCQPKILEEFPSEYPTPYGHKEGLSNNKSKGPRSNSTSHSSIQILTETVLKLSSSIQPILTAWNNGGFHPSKDKVVEIPKSQKVEIGKPVFNGHLDVGEGEKLFNANKKLLFEGNSAYFMANQPPIGSITKHDAIQKGNLNQGDKVKLLNPCDGELVAYGRIQSLSLCHGESLGKEEVNVSVYKVLHNIPLPYEDRFEGCINLQEKIDSFIKWPVKYLIKVKNEHKD